MLLIPFRVSERDFSIFVILQDENIERIKAYDPAQVMMSKLTPEWHGLRLRHVLIGFASKAEVDELLASVAPNTGEWLKRLSRGFVFKPESGDYDGSYIDVSPGPKDRQ